MGLVDQARLTARLVCGLVWSECAAPGAGLGRGSSSGKSIEETTKEIDEHYNKVRLLARTRARWLHVAGPGLRLWGEAECCRRRSSDGTGPGAGQRRLLVHAGQAHGLHLRHLPRNAQVRVRRPQGRAPLASRHRAPRASPLGCIMRQSRAGQRGARQAEGSEQAGHGPRVACGGGVLASPGPSPSPVPSLAWPGRV
jgi:hypothetical protein